MDKLEKVIKGLECLQLHGTIVFDSCEDCPWSNTKEGCLHYITKEAITLLKAQEPEAMDASKPDSDIGCWYDITHNYTLEQVVSALKMQEPVEPKRNDVKLTGLRTFDWTCPECNCILIYRANYCSCCGRAVKWE